VQGMPAESPTRFLVYQSSPRPLETQPKPSTITFVMSRPHHAWGVVGRGGSGSASASL
jgi:hypothetical protein